MQLAWRNIDKIHNFQWLRSLADSFKWVDIFLSASDIADTISCGKTVKKDDENDQTTQSAISRPAVSVKSKSEQ